MGVLSNENDVGASVTIKEEERNERWQTKTNTLTDGIRHIYKTKEFSDTVYVVNGKPFKVHRLILGARSPEFKQTFFVDNPPSEVRDVCSPIGFEILLRYIYTDEIGTTNRKEILEAYRVAKKFKQDELMEECEKLTEDWMIEIDNVFTILNDVLDIEVLKRRCFQFIKVNSRAALNSPDFINVTPITLVDILDQNCFAEVPVAEVLHAVLNWGLEQFPKLDDCSKLREYLMGNQILAKLKLHKLTVTELINLAANYPQLLTAEEILKFQLRANMPDKNLPIPSWAEQQ